MDQSKHRRFGSTDSSSRFDWQRSSTPIVSARSPTLSVRPTTPDRWSLGPGLLHKQRTEARSPQARGLRALSISPVLEHIDRAVPWDILAMCGRWPTIATTPWARRGRASIRCSPPAKEQAQEVIGEAHRSAIARRHRNVAIVIHTRWARHVHEVTCAGKHVSATLVFPNSATGKPT